MQSQDEPTARKSLPAWFSAVTWSFIGIFAAILTICVLSASLLWLLRWTNQQTTRLTTLTPAGLVTQTSGGTAWNASSISTPRSGTPGPDNVSSDRDQGSSSTSAAPSATTEPGDLVSTLTPLSGTPGPDDVSSDRNQGTSSASAASSTTTEPGDLAATSGTSPGTVNAAEQASATSSALEAASAESTQSPTPGAASASTSAAGLPPADLTATAGFNSTPDLLEFTPTATVSPSPSRTATAVATDTPTRTRTPTATHTPTPTPEPQVYIVQGDDWLSKLSDKFYGDVLAYPAIVAATNAKAAEDNSFTVIDDPDIIEIGQKLWLPTPAEVEILLEAEE